MAILHSNSSVSGHVLTIRSYVYARLGRLWVREGCQNDRPHHMDMYIWVPTLHVARQPENALRNTSKNGLRINLATGRRSLLWHTLVVRARRVSGIAHASKQCSDRISATNMLGMPRVEVKMPRLVGHLRSALSSFDSVLESGGDFERARAFLSKITHDLHGDVNGPRTFSQLRIRIAYYLEKICYCTCKAEHKLRLECPMRLNLTRGLHVLYYSEHCF
ncbi:hypothetical protein DFH11DRAFT_207243 [Phellopilus nigrolimitatus]|nr:hypothetical protein DFH11DRAFT_207243 [Phellopilus nigrolimitatus]